MVLNRPIYQTLPTHPSCHAATAVEVGGGELLAAWFAGAHEGNADVAIWLARFDGAMWSEPVMVADEPQVPLWNPVLFRDGEGTVWLFYKAGPHVPSWTGLYTKSTDDGRTWLAPQALPAGLLGPAKNKPLLLSNGQILSGTSSESWHAWSCWVEISGDGGGSWTKHGPILAPGWPGEEKRQTDEPVSAVWDAEAHALLLPQRHYGVIQPTMWEYAPGCVRMLMRATQQVGFVCAAVSGDFGRTWSAATRTAIPCSNSGLDAVRLQDGRVLLVCNPVRDGRTPLSLLLSEDNGDTWPWRLDLETEPGEYSYPSIIQASGGLVHVVYTHRREHIQHAMLNPDEIGSGEGWRRSEWGSTGA